MTDTYAVVDCEATGLDTKNDRVIQVAIIHLDSDGTVTNQWTTLINPGTPIPADVTSLTGISDVDVADAPSFAEIAEELKNLIDGRVFVAHNTRYDANLLYEELSRVGVTAQPTKVLCTIKLARKALGGQTNRFNLEDLTKHLGIEQLHAHDAVDDALVTAQVLMELEGRVTDKPFEEWGNLKVKSSWKVNKIEQVECPYTNPGKFTPEGGLIQGMRVIFTGGNEDRDEITRLAQAAGLDAAGKISGTSSLLVTDDPQLGTFKTREAEKKGVPMVDYATMMTLLQTVKPGKLKA